MGTRRRRSFDTAKDVVMSGDIGRAARPVKNAGHGEKAAEPGPPRFVRRCSSARATPIGEALGVG